VSAIIFNFLQSLKENVSNNVLEEPKTMAIDIAGYKVFQPPFSNVDLHLF
jgi:hypothetical protein